MSEIKGLSKRKGVLRAIAEWQKTIWYPVTFALLGVVAATFGWHVYVPVLYILAASVVFAALFCDDVKVMLVPVMLIYYSIGSDVMMTTNVSRNDMLGAFELPGLINMLVAGGIVLTAVVSRLISSGTVRVIVHKRGILTAGMLCMAAALLLNGVGSPSWEIVDLGLGALMAAGLMAMYFIVLAVGSRSEGVTAYVCKLCFVCGMMICAESWLLIARTAADGTLFKMENGNFTGGINRYVLAFGWGEANIVAGTLVALIPPVMYFAYIGRFGIFPYIAALVMYFTVLILNARTSILMGIIVLVACMALACFGKRRDTARMMTLVSLALAAFGTVIAFSVIGFERVPGFLSNMFRVEQGDNQRFERWADGMRDFTRAPVFGVGFADGAGAGATDVNIYSNMYHNIGVELFGAMGIAGVIAFIVHIKGVLELLVRKFSAARLVLLLCPVSVIMTSTLDNFFFYFNVQLIYSALLAAAELDLEEKRAKALAACRKPKAGRKPRVAFTFVEAGMGHIVPEKAVAEAFEKKYGDKAEVILSHFYSETGDKDMLRFEKGFVDTVMSQSRSRVFGKLCILGNVLAGDALAQRFVMRMRVPDSKADRRALVHLAELDADYVFTTHWATATYAARLPDGLRPYTMMLCPDPYSNGMFNVDVSDFLMTTEAGAKRTGRRRMYAGGNVSVVPYPIRNEAYSLLGRKAELRKAAGIGEDEFVAIFADGGYGMAKLEETVKELLALDADMRIIAVCGKNEEGAERLRALRPGGKTRLDVYGFAENMLELMAMSDIFVGKSGANSMAEPTFFGMPIIITKCITPIEDNTRKYYVRNVGNAMYIPSPRKAAARLAHLAAHRDELEPYAENARTRAVKYGAEAVADFIYERISSAERPEGKYTVVNYNG